MTTIDEMLKDRDWKEVFDFASFSVGDVASIIKSDEGCNDGDRWLAVGTLKNGDHFILSAGCDYTGWDCRSWGDCETAGSLADLIRWRMSDDDRRRMGYTLPPETDGAPLPVVEN